MSGLNVMTPTEEQVAAICAEMLGLEHVELDDNLYELGSDSHQAVLVALEIESVFQVSLPLEVLESTASVRALAAWVEDQRRQPASPASTPSDPTRDG